MMSGNDGRINVLVVSLPGIMQNMLCEILNTNSDVNVVGVASGGLSAVNMIHQKRPDLVVIDSSLPVSEAIALVKWMKEEYQSIRTLILAETTKQVKRAASAGADIIIRSYSLPEGFDRVIANIKSE